MTGNHDYNTPSKGTTDWHISLNSNFEALDTDIEIRDQKSALGNYKPKDGAKFLATDTGDIYLGDGSNWNAVGSISGDETETAVYVKNYPGSDLATKVQSALADLPNGSGRIIVTPTSDSDGWSWGSNLNLNPNDYGGIHIDIAKGTRIEYGGDGYALTLDTDGDPNTQASTGNFVRITGGTWAATGSDPNGGIQLKDCYRTVLEPHHMSNWRNSDGDAACISVENHASYSEDTKVRDVRLDGDIGIDFKEPRITGGSGTHSFVNTHVENCTFNCDGPGLKMCGAFNDSVFINNEWFVRNNGQDLVFLEGYADNSVFICPRFDNIAGHTDVTAFHFGSAYDTDTGPMVLQPVFNDIPNDRIDDSGNWVRTPLITGDNGAHVGLIGWDSYFEVQDSQFNWVLNGQRVANLDVSGNLVLRGSLTENGSP